MAHTLDGQGDRRAALSAYEQSVALFRETGDRWALAHPLCDLALRTWDEGRLHEAFGLIQEYLGVFRQLRSLGGVPMALGYLSFMAVGIGDFAVAVQAAQEKAEIEASRGLPIDRAYGLQSIASVHLAQGHLDQAQALLEEVFALGRDSPDQSFVAETLYLLGQTAFYAGRLEEAAERLTESRRLGGGTDRPRLEAQTLFVLGQVANRRAAYAEALALMQESLLQHQEVRPRIPPRLEGLAQVWLGLGEPERAVTLLSAADCLRRAMGSPIPPVERADDEQTRAALQASLPDTDFARAWAAGQTLSLPETLAYALDGEPAQERTRRLTAL